MQLNADLDDAHAHLADTSLAILRAVERDPNLDPGDVREAVRSITAAQDRLLRLSAAVRQSSRSATTPLPKNSPLCPKS